LIKSLLKLMQLYRAIMFGARGTIYIVMNGIYKQISIY